MPEFTSAFGEISSSLEGIIVSSILISATFVSLFSGALSDSLGRTRCLAIGALLFAMGAAVEAAAVHLGMFIAGRCVVGFGEGMFLSTLVVYVAEISPPQWRGPLCTVVQLFITLGLVVGFFVCYGTVSIDSSLSWRLPLAMQSGLAFFLSIASFFYLPQSPRWLAYKGRKEEASRVWDKLGVSSAEREKDLLKDSATPAGAEVVEIPTTQAAAKAKNARERMQKNWADLTVVFRKDTRKPLLLGVFLMSMQQLSGIDGVIFYAPLLFQQAGLDSSEASFLASGVSAICIFAFTILAVIFVDRWGRRASTIYGGLVLFTCMAIMGTLYASKSVHSGAGAGRWIVILMIYIFAIVYSMTWAVGVKLFASEIQPVATRATAVSLAQSANCITNFFVALLTPILLSRSSSAIYFLFGTCLLVTVVISTIYMPETRGADLETTGAAFGARGAAGICRC
ncbi:nonribosomal peptide synthase atnA [Physcia stellaris]|nr:nonribosomal peptide synthase atnA [Physcia stellaris]